jgi:hypothetical protein
MFSIRMTASGWHRRTGVRGSLLRWFSNQLYWVPRLTIEAHNVSCFRICQEDLNIDVQLQTRVDKEHVR